MFGEQSNRCRYSKIIDRGLKSRLKTKTTPLYFALIFFIKTTYGQCKLPTCNVLMKFWDYESSNL